MRISLFRGKRIDNGEWVYGYYVAVQYPTSEDGKPYKHLICNGTNVFNYNYEVDPNTVSEYSGTDDINGKNIFEGDIVQDMGVYLTHKKYLERGIEDFETVEKYRECGAVSQVEFCTENVASCGCCYTHFSGTGFKADNVNMSECIVIGNIYDKGR